MSTFLRIFGIRWSDIISNEELDRLTGLSQVRDAIGKREYQ